MTPAVLHGADWVNTLCPVTVDGRQLLASGDDDRTVRIWEPGTGELRAVLEGHEDRVAAACPVTVDGRQLLASGGLGGTVRIWDPGTGEPRAVLHGADWVNTLCAVTVDGRQLLASGSHDRTVRIWDPGTGAFWLTVPTHHAVLAVAAVAESLAVGLTAGLLVIKFEDQGA